MAEDSTVSVVTTEPRRDARSTYNERLSFGQNTNVTIIESSSRSTRYRNKKRKFRDKHLDSSRRTLVISPSDEILNENFEVNPEAFVENNQSENAQLCSYDTFQSEIDQNEAIITFSDNFDSDPLILEAELFAADHDVAEENCDEEFEVSSSDQDSSKIDQESSATSNDMLLYTESSLTLSASNIMIMQYKMRHNLTDQSLIDLLNLLKIHCPKPNYVPSSIYHFKKFFRESKYQIKYHYYCTRCLQNIDTFDIICSLCSSDLQEGKAKSSFIEIPIESQLEVLFACKLVRYTHVCV